jgi:Holliday junction resolvasome RuvABC endonuclease subunit
MLSVLGVDPSLSATACWHACGTLDAPTIRGFEIKSRGLKAFANPIERLCALRDALASQLDRCATDAAPGLAVVENYAFGAHNSREALGEWGGVLRVLLHERGWSVLLVAPATLKSWCTGTGRGSKGMMAMHVLRRWGHESSSDDEADSFALMQLGIEWLAVEGGAPTTKRTAEVFKKLAPMAAAHTRPSSHIRREESDAVVST